MKERKIRELIGEQVIITTDFQKETLKELKGTLDKEITNKPFKENTMIYYRDDKNLLCGVEFKYIKDIKKI